MRAASKAKVDVKQQEAKAIEDLNERIEKLDREGIETALQRARDLAIADCEPIARAQNLLFSLSAVQFFDLRVEKAISSNDMQQIQSIVDEAKRLNYIGSMQAPNLQAALNLIEQQLEKERQKKELELQGDNVALRLYRPYRDYTNEFLQLRVSAVLFCICIMLSSLGFVSSINVRKFQTETQKSLFQKER
jgi:hypothetical protein